MIMHMVWARAGVTCSHQYTPIVLLQQASVLSPNHILEYPPAPALPPSCTCVLLAPPHTGVRDRVQAISPHLLYWGSTTAPTPTLMDDTHASDGEPLPPSVSQGCQDGGPGGAAAGAAAGPSSAMAVGGGALGSMRREEVVEDVDPSTAMAAEDVDLSTAMAAATTEAQFAAIKEGVAALIKTQAARLESQAARIQSQAAAMKASQAVAMGAMAAKIESLKSVVAGEEGCGRPHHLSPVRRTHRHHLPRTGGPPPAVAVETMAVPPTTSTSRDEEPTPFTSTSCLKRCLIVVSKVHGKNGLRSSSRILRLAVDACTSELTWSGPREVEVVGPPPFLTLQILQNWWP